MEPVLIAEIHVDELPLDAGCSWLGTARLLLEIASAAESVGARLTFRFRKRFAAEAARQGSGNVLRLLEEQGHEVGTHCHGRSLGRSRKAVDACGVDNRGVSPGMVQAGRRYGRLFDRAAALGFAWMTDSPPLRVWSAAGLLPWVPGRGYSSFRNPLGMVSVEVSVSPFDWGILFRKNGKVEHGFRVGHKDFRALASLLERHRRREMPWPWRSYFCFTMHEHNFCAPGSTRPCSSSLDAFADFLTGARVVTAGRVASWCWEHGVAECREQSRSGTHGLSSKAPRLVALKPSAVATPCRRFAHRGMALAAGIAARTINVKVGSDALHARWHGPSRPLAVLLISHAGKRGGTTLAGQPWGLRFQRLASQGVAVVTWDRRGTGRSRKPGQDVDLAPGNPLHVADFQAVFDEVEERLKRLLATNPPSPGQSLPPIGVLSFSSGVLPPLRARRPMAFLMDTEAPADRWSLLPPETGPAAPGSLAHLSLMEDSAWEGREPVALVGRIRCPYHRLQARVDHVHGRLHLHAFLMLEAALMGKAPEIRLNGGRFPWNRSLLPGRIHQNSRLVHGWIWDEIERARNRVDHLSHHVRRA